MIELHKTEMGSASVTRTVSNFVLKTFGTNDEDQYCNAQISSYRDRSEINLTPPIRMTLQARFEGNQGTAGFGFWNHPLMSGMRSFRMPKAVWFFYGSSHNNIHLAKGVPGHGWKTGTIDSTRWQFWAMLPTAPVGFLLMRVPFLYNRLWSIGQAALGVSEFLLDSNIMSDWHTYQLDWLSNGVKFYVDTRLVHRTGYSPRGKLGFIAWIDNQYAIVTPQGRFQGGFITSKNEQTLYLRDIHVTKL